jgi:protein-L-isoaspartate(D-aspartate) O-methyltransferase
VIDKITAIKTKRMADEIDSVFELTPRVKEAIINTDRERFVPVAMRQHAYKLDALPIGAKQWISSPLTVAKMTEYLEPEGADRVLEIGCGSGYQAAVLSHLFRGVFTIERIEQLIVEAKQRFRELGIQNVHTRTDDGQKGWVQYAPYDRILFSAAPTHIPQALVDQLVPRGVIVAPMEKDGKQVITRFVKVGDELLEDELETCEFVPVLDGVQR